MSDTDFGTEAVVLSGGGAYAAYAVGVLKALVNGESPASQHQPIAPKIFAGTSAGAINSSILISHSEKPITAAVDFLEQAWLQKIAHVPGHCGNGVYRVRGNPQRYVDPSCVAGNPIRPITEFLGDALFLARDGFQRSVDFIASSDPIERRFLELVDFTSLITTQAFESNLPKLIQLGKIRESDKLLKVNTTNWRTGRSMLFTNHDMTDANGYQILLATTSVPIVFPPVNRIDGDIHIDGMLTIYAPLKPTIDAGADTIHVIYVDPDPRDAPLKELQNTIDSLDRIWTITFANQVVNDVETARKINGGLTLLETFDEGNGETASDEALKAFIRVASSVRKRIHSKNPYRKLTVHCHHPKGLLGGILGLLDFEQATISRLIELGLDDARNHDCQASGCVLP